MPLAVDERHIADPRERVQAVGPRTGRIRPQHAHRLFVELGGREPHDAIDRHAAAIGSRAVLRRTVQLSIVDERRPGGTRGAQVAFHGVHCMRFPGTEQIRGVEHVELRRVLIPAIAGEHPPPSRPAQESGIRSREVRQQHTIRLESLQGRIRPEELHPSERTDLRHDVRGALVLHDERVGRVHRQSQDFRRRTARAVRADLDADDRSAAFPIEHAFREHQQRAIRALDSERIREIAVRERRAPADLPRVEVFEAVVDRTGNDADAPLGLLGVLHDARDHVPQRGERHGRAEHARVDARRTASGERRARAGRE